MGLINLASINQKIPNKRMVRIVRPFSGSIPLESQYQINKKNTRIVARKMTRSFEIALMRASRK